MGIAISAEAYSSARRDSDKPGWGLMVAVSSAGRLQPDHRRVYVLATEVPSGNADASLSAAAQDVARKLPGRADMLDAVIAGDDSDGDSEEEQPIEWSRVDQELDRQVVLLLPPDVMIADMR